MTDLLPCPFCGGIARIAKGFNDGEIVYCENEDCHVRPELNGYHEPETAIEMWNSRVSAPNKSAEVDLDALKREINEIIDYDSNKELSRTSLKNIAAQTIDYLASEGHLATGKGGDE